MIKKPLLIMGIAVMLSVATFAQNKYWSFSKPESFMHEQLNGKDTYEETSLAPVMQNYNDHLFIAWTADNGAVNVKLIGEAVLNKNSNLPAGNFNKVSLGFYSATAPALAYANAKLFLLFRDKEDGYKIKYTSIVNAGNKFSPANIRTLDADNTTDANGGIYACEYAADKLFITWKEKDGLQAMVCSISSDGRLSKLSQFLISEQSIAVPSACYLDKEKVGIAWTGTDNDHRLNFMAILKGKTQKKQIFTGSSSSATPVIYKKWGRKDIHMVWKGKGDDKKIWQAVFTEGQSSLTQKAASDVYDINTTAAPSIVHVDDNNYIMVFKGKEDKRMYISYLATYEYSKWMEQTLGDNSTLGEVTIPGSHDAGMSEVNYCGIGGNKCNAVTQTFNIKTQMNKGIRYFDLRPASVKDSKTYTGHYVGTSGAAALLGCNGEAMDDVFDDINTFLKNNPKEFIILNVTHFRHYDNDITHERIKKLISSKFSGRLFTKTGTAYSTKNLSKEKISALRGKVIVSSDASEMYKENYVIRDMFENDNDQREYAGTDNLDTLLKKQESFLKKANRSFTRLDWQLTQGVGTSIDCDRSIINCGNGFRWSFSQIFKVIIDCGSQAFVWPYSAYNDIFANDNSILRLANDANQKLPASLDNWIKKGYITKTNRINIIYVDIADTWVTDLCVDMNRL